MSEGNKKSLVYVTRGLSHPLDAVNLYYMHKNPSIGKVTVIPFFGVNSYGTYDRNFKFGTRGKDLFQNDAQANLIGFDLEEVFGALEDGAQPKSQKSKDIYEFTTKAFEAYTAKRTMSEEEITSLHDSGISSVDVQTMKQDKTRLFSTKELNEQDMVLFDFHADTVRGFAEGLDKPFFLNNRDNTFTIDGKGYLPTLSEEVDGAAPDAQRAIALNKNVTTPDEVRAFMDQHAMQQAIIKPHRGAHGAGIYTVTKHEDGTLTTSRNGKEGPNIKNVLKQGKMLLMERLEPNKGDVRLIGMNGKIIGAYNRIPGDGNDIANITGDGGGTPHDYTLTAGDRKTAEKILKDLKQKGINFVGLDLMADSNDNRRLIEVNVGFHGGLEKIHDYELDRKPSGMTAAERHTQGIVDAFKSRNQTKEPAMAM